MPYSLREFSFFSSLKIFLLFSFIIAVCCFIGIASRPLSFLAFFWPANSVLLGLLIRFPSTRRLSSFLGAYSGYVVADLLQGTPFALTLVLTTSNFLYVVTTFALYMFFLISILKQPTEVILTFFICFMRSRKCSRRIVCSNFRAHV